MPQFSSNNVRDDLLSATCVPCTGTVKHLPYEFLESICFHTCSAAFPLTRHPQDIPLPGTKISRASLGVTICPRSRRSPTRKGASSSPLVVLSSFQPGFGPPFRTFHPCNIYITSCIHIILPDDTHECIRNRDPLNKPYSPTMTFFPKS
jgi:hypothetical protein